MLLFEVASPVALTSKLTKQVPLATPVTVNTPFEIDAVAIVGAEDVAVTVALGEVSICNASLPVPSIVTSCNALVIIAVGLIKSLTSSTGN